MNDENGKKNEPEEQPTIPEVGARDPPGVMLVERPVKPGRVEIKVPLGVAVIVASKEWGTKIVLLGFPGHGDADEGS